MSSPVILQVRPYIAVLFVYGVSDSEKTLAMMMLYNK